MDFRAVQGNAGFLRLLRHALPKQLCKFREVVSMGAETGKRMAGDYVIIHAFHIGDREIVLGENPAVVGDERYIQRVYAP